MHVRLVEACRSFTLAALPRGPAGCMRLPGQTRSETWLHRAREMPKEDFRREGGEGSDGEGNGAVGADLLQGLQEPDPGHRAGDRDGSADAGHGTNHAATVWR